MTGIMHSISAAVNVVILAATASLHCYPELLKSVLQYMGLDREDAAYFTVIILCYSALSLIIRLIAALISTVFNFTNEIPGPRLAKFTILWKLFYIRNGTYNKKVNELHLLYGAIIQTGPYEYSVSDSTRFKSSAGLERTPPPYSTFVRRYCSQIFHTVESVLKMANIFQHEPEINRCNAAVLQSLLRYAESGKELDLCDLIIRYAYEIMFATTVGHAPGFLSQQLDVSKLLQEVDDWKFHTLLYGSYFRFYPVIAKLFGLLPYHKSLQQRVSRYFGIITAQSPSCDMSQLLSAAQEQDSLSRSSIEACIAAIIAESDPTISHIVTSLFYIYQDRELLERLRKEIAAANISYPATIKELILKKARMPLLHAVLDESLRLGQPHTGGLSYVAPKGGVRLGNNRIPEDASTAHVHSSLFGGDTSFDPKQRLTEPPVARQFRIHLLAFGASTSQCPGQDLHTAIVSKLLTSIIPNFDIEMASNNTEVQTMTHYQLKTSLTCIITLPKLTQLFVPPGEKIGGIDLDTIATPTSVIYNGAGLVFDTPGAIASAGDDVNTTTTSAPTNGNNVAATAPPANVNSSPNPSNASLSSSSSGITVGWQDEKALEALVGRETTNELLTLIDPTRTNLPKLQGPVTTAPITNSRNRALTHEAIERIWAGRLIHQTTDDYRMHIWVPGSRVSASLDSLYKRRKSKPTQQSSTVKRNGAAPAPASNKQDLKRSVPASAPASKTVDAKDITWHQGWTGFAMNEHTRVDDANKLSTAEYGQKYNVDASKPVATEGDKTLKATFKETSRITATQPKVETVASPVSTKPKATVPPHLRAKHNSAVAAAEAVTTTNETVWVAAKLPNTSSD